MIKEGNRVLVSIVILFGALLIAWVALDSSGNSEASYSVLMLGLLCIGLILVSLFYSRFSVGRSYGVVGLVGKKVYSNSGDFAGFVKDVLISGVKIYGLKIKVKGERKLFLVKIENISNFGEVILIEDSVAEKLE